VALKCAVVSQKYPSEKFIGVVCVCLLLQYLLQSCSHGGGGGNNGGHVLRETTNRSLCGLRVFISLPITH
jgi:hypothetical protein